MSTYAHRVLEQARLRPDADALVWTGGTVTYGELADRVNALAAVLAEHGVGRGDPVGLRVPRGPAQVVGMAAVTLAGGVIVPMTPPEPDQRLRRILADCAAGVVVCGADVSPPPTATRTVVVDGAGVHPKTAPDITPPRLGPRDGAYLMYTSGSTGDPKGVLVEHGSLSAYLDWCAATLLDPATPLPATASLAFDAVFKQVLAPLTVGSRAWLVDDATATDPVALAAALAAAGPCSVNCVPTVWRAQLAEFERPGAARPDLRRILLGGEDLDADTLARTRRLLPDAEIWNLYGPTETTANASAGRIGSDRPRLGDPLPGVSVHVLDADAQPVGEGGTGELFIGGIGVARCYAGRPADTADRFVPDPFATTPGQRMFRTGDHALVGSRGELTYAGRRDRMVKRAGVRVELGEVETAFARLPQVHDAAAVLLGTGPSQLLAVAIEADPPPTVPDLRRAVAASLPRPAVPDVIRVLPRLPRTAGGKVDSAALRDVFQGRPRDRGGVPTDPVAAILVAVWADVLDRDAVSVDDDFFELGGHSLAMLRIAGRVAELLDVELPVDVLYDVTTVAELTPMVRAQLSAAGREARP